MISGATDTSTPLIQAALLRVGQAYRPSTTASHLLHFKTFIAFMVFMNLPVSLSVHNILIFLEYLYVNSLSPKVIKNYLSSLASMAKQFRIDSSNIYHHTVHRYLRSISINSKFAPTPRGIFDIKTLYDISVSCDTLSDPILFRSIFLTAYFGFLRMSNFAPHSLSKFHPDKHFLLRDLVFAPPGAHLLIKWTKTLQDHKSHHVIQLPELDNIFLCPVRALKALISSRHLDHSAPLFANSYPPYNQVIDSHIRYALKQILTIRNISPLGHGFHTFRRSGATYAFDHNVAIQNIMAHGLWKSSSVWTYLQNASQAASIIPNTFASTVPSTL